jgi:GNAT superfamily N-acetyltransferase
MTPATPAPKGRIAIRDARKEDAGLVLAFIRGLAIYEKLLGDVEATEAMVRDTLFPEAPGTPVARVIIGEVDGTPAGFAIYFFNYSTFLARPGIYLEDLFVEPAHRRLGLGKALILHLANKAREMGCGRMEWSVLDWNKPAIDFYKSLGAAPLDEWTVFRLDRAALEKLPR